jgi:hypothetical protein
MYWRKAATKRYYMLSSTIKPRLYVSVAGCVYLGLDSEPPWPQMAMHASVDLYIIKSGSYHGSGACLDLSNPDPKFALGLVYFTQKAKSFQDSPSHRILWYMHEALNIDESKKLITQFS